MRPLLDNALKQLREFFGRMSKKERIRFGILAAIVIVLAIITVSLLSRTTYELLYNAQDITEAGEIYAAVEGMGIPVQIEGTRILVPEGRADEIRVRLANEGVFSQDPGTDFLDAMSGFGTTEDHRQMLIDAQRSAYIRSQILNVARIDNAIVNVVSGRASPFAVARNSREATASVMLTVRGGTALSNREVQSIADIVRGSVPGISYDNITINDSNLNHYKLGDSAEDIGTEVNSRIALQSYLAQQIQIQAEDLLTPVFGLNRVRVQANVVLNFDSEIIERIEFFPPIAGEMDGIIRSQHELFEVQRSAGVAEGIPGTDENLNPPQYPYGPLGDDEEYRKLVRDQNYEINQTITMIERERGQIRELSVSVLIDSESVEEDYSAGIKNLLTGGMGIAQANIFVETMPFREDYLAADAEMLAWWQEQERLSRQRELVETIIMWAVILLLGLSFLSLVRSIVRVVKGEQIEEVALAGGGIDYLADDDLEEDDEPMEDIELTTKSSNLEQIERFIEKDPAAVAQLLRNWLTDE